MVINKAFLDSLTAQAKASPRLRMHYDLRDSADDDCQRMLNAIKPGTFIPPHRHTNTSEDVVVLRGIAEEVFFSDDGQEISRIQLVPGSDLTAVHIPIGQYHQLRSLQSGTVVIEFKNTRYAADYTEDYLMALKKQ